MRVDRSPRPGHHMGFTLVELLVALSLALVMLLALVVMYGNSSRSTN